MFVFVNMHFMFLPALITPMEQHPDVQNKPSFSAALAILDKVQELRWTLQALAAGLFADSLLVWFTGRGLNQWSTSTDQFLTNIGYLLTGILGFAVLMAIVLPLIGGCSRWLIGELTIHLPLPKWPQDFDPYRRPTDCVMLQELHELALEKGDKFVLDIYASHEQKRVERKTTKDAMGQIMFSVLVLGIANYLADGFGARGPTLTRSLVLWLGQTGETALILASLFAAAGIKAAWSHENGMEWVYYPPLYRQIVAERKRRTAPDPYA
jgi:hypothetical protein